MSEHEHVEAAEHRDRVGHRLLCLRGIADISSDRHGPAAARLDRLRSGAERIRPPADQRDRAAVGGHPPRRGGADPATGTGDEGCARAGDA